MNSKRIVLLLVSTGFWLHACATTEIESRLTVAPPDATEQNTQTLPASPAPTATRTPDPSPTLAEPLTPTPTALPSATITPQPTASPIPTSAILRGVVIPDKVSCRYGPGAMYLYLYGLVKTATQDIIGRTDSGNWVLTRSHGDDKACWIKTEFLELNGDVLSVEMVYPDKFRIPQSNQGYRLPWDVVALRKGEAVTISWQSEALRPGDEESATSVLYVVETWVCKDGQLWFTPIGAYAPQVTVTDQPGCKEPSHGRVFFSEKHGYTGPTEILWPPAE
ncbi:MAG: hypothetical protein NTW32_16255 [Chloroflexi bacterium]|nr:hypothetical protein [Chloroflexota bacterium]